MLMNRIFNFMNRDIPRRLRMGKFPYSSILYILLSSTFFMLLYMPFSPTTWFSVRTPQLAILTIAFVFIAVGILVLSNALFISFCRTRKCKKWNYILWCIAEIVAISIAYICFTLIFSLGNYHSSASLWVKTFCCVTLILSIPYSIIYAYFESLERKRRTEMQQNNDSRDEFHEPAVKHLKDRMVSIMDDSGELKFSVDLDSVLYIKSDGNYVNIFYEKGDAVVSHTLKMSIGTLEEKLAGTPLVRCQRSYIVNTRRVKMMQNDSKATYIIVDNDRVPVLPLSPNYATAVLKALY